MLKSISSNYDINRLNYDTKAINIISINERFLRNPSIPPLNPISYPTPATQTPIPTMPPFSRNSPFLGTPSSELSSIFEIDNDDNLLCNAATDSLAILHETKLIFKNIIGYTEFKDVYVFPVEDSPIPYDPNKILDPMPSREVCLRLFYLFEVQFNWQYFVLDKDCFFNTVMANNQDPKLKILIYLVLAIAALMENTNNRQTHYSINYFQSALYLHNNLPDDGEIWLVKSNYLQALYYKFIGRLKTSWSLLRTAIKYSGSIKLDNDKESVNKYNKRLLTSLYVSDRIFSVIAGKPMSFEEEDSVLFKDDNIKKEFDRLDPNLIYSVPNKITYIFDPDVNDSFRDKLDFYSLKIFRIMTKILNLYHKKDPFNFDTLKNISLELKDYLSSLPPELLVENTSTGKSVLETKHRYACVFLSASHIYAIILMSRPFLLYEKTYQYIPNANNLNFDLKFIKGFIETSIKSSTLMLIATTQLDDSDIRRLESNVRLNCAFTACMTLGVGLLDHLDEKLIKILRVAIQFFKEYERISQTANSYATIVNEMINSMYYFHNSNPCDLNKPKKEFSSGFSDLKVDSFKDLDSYHKNLLEDQTNLPSLDLP